MAYSSWRGLKYLGFAGLFALAFGSATSVIGFLLPTRGSLCWPWFVAAALELSTLLRLPDGLPLCFFGFPSWEAFGFLGGLLSFGVPIWPIFLDFLTLAMIDCRTIHYRGDFNAFRANGLAIFCIAEKKKGNRNLLPFRYRVSYDTSPVICSS